MRNHFRPKPPPLVTITPPESDDNSDIEILDAPKAHAANPEQTPTSSEASRSVALFVGYLSDEISGPSDEEPEPEVEWEPQQPKRRKLDVPYESSQPLGEGQICQVLPVCIDIYRCARVHSSCLMK